MDPGLLYTSQPKTWHTVRLLTSMIASISTHIKNYTPALVSAYRYKFLALIMNYCTLQNALIFDEMKTHFRDYSKVDEGWTGIMSHLKNIQHEFERFFFINL